jgi:hypothetical protein
MDEPTLLANDDARRNQQHDSVKEQVEDDVNAELAQRASNVPTPGQARKLDQVAGTYKENAIEDVASAEREVQRSRGLARLSQFINYAFFLLYALLGIRFVLALLGAQSSGFVTFVETLSAPFFAPFRNIIGEMKGSPGSSVTLSIAVAVGAYLILHLIINRLLLLIATRQDHI